MKTGGTISTDQRFHQFTFPSAGIRVTFRGSDLFLGDKFMAEFEDKYVGRVSERTLWAMLVCAQNTKAIKERSKMWGDFGPSFNTWTSFLSTEELSERWKEVKKNSHVYLNRVRKLTGGCLTWVFEFGKQGGRPHGHFVMDRWMSVDQQWDAKGWRNSLMGRCHMCELGAPGYMWKEMGKSVGRRGTGVRLMGSMGDFVGRCTMSDFLIDSPAAECRRLAMQEQLLCGGTRKYTERTGQAAGALFRAWLAGRMSLGEEYDRYRESIQGSVGRAEHGDSWEEEEGGDTEFNVEDFK
jgi:hypothetical protein